MQIVFVETEPSEVEYFREELREHDVRFVGALDEVGAEVEVLSVFIYSRIDAAFLEAHPALQFIATRSSGIDHIDLAACEARGVDVSFVRSYGENTVAEHTFALMLSLSRRIRASLEANQKRKFSYEAIRGFDLEKKTLGVIGTGRIGMHTIRIAKAFDMCVLAYDIVEKPLVAAVRGFEYAPLDDVLAAADILTLHIPLVPATHHLLDRAAFAKCKRGVLVINTSRGALIETEALVEALDSGIVGAAGLDVLEEERVMQREALNLIGDQIISKLQSGLTSHELRVQNPARIQELTGLMRNQQLISRENVVFTPHTAFNSVEAVARIGRTTVENIRGFLEGAPRNTVTGGLEW